MLGVVILHMAVNSLQVSCVKTLDSMWISTQPFAQDFVGAGFSLWCVAACYAAGPGDADCAVQAGCTGFPVLQGH